MRWKQLGYSKSSCSTSSMIIKFAWYHVIFGCKIWTAICNLSTHTAWRDIGAWGYSCSAITLMKYEPVISCYAVWGIAYWLHACLPHRHSRHNVSINWRWKLLVAYVIFSCWIDHLRYVTYQGLDTFVMSRHDKRIGVYMKKLIKNWNNKSTSL